MSEATAIASPSASPPDPPAVGTRDLLRLAWPILVAQLAVMGMALIDTVMAGRLSPQDLAVVALGASIYATVYVALMGVLQALTPIAGHHFGAGRWREIGLDLGQALWLAAFMSLAGIPLLLWDGLWLGITQPEPELARGLTQFLVAIAIGLPGGLLMRAFIAMNAAVSRPKASMVIQLTTLALKLPLNLVFIYGAGPIPALGGVGCGVATAALLWLGALLNWALWRFDPFYARFRPTRSDGHHGPSWPRLRELLKLGLPIGGSFLLEVSSFTLIAMLLARFGAIAVGGHQIVANIVSILFMVPLSLGVAASVLVSQSLGAGDPRQARRAALRGWRFTMTLVAALALIMALAREPIVTAYTSNAEVAALASSLMLVGALFHLFDGMQGVSGFILRGYKVALAPLVVHAVALWGVGIGGGCWLAFFPPAGWTATPAMGFWTAATAALLLAGPALTLLLLRTARRE